MSDSKLTNNYTLDGVIVRGKGLGKKFGMPTANIHPDNSFSTPPFGVYSSIITIRGTQYNALTNIGLRPSVDDSSLPTIEAHILDFDDDIYGEEVSLSLIRFIRPTQKFNNLTEVKAQLDKDILSIEKV